jgi:hypothetical protein
MAFAQSDITLEPAADAFLEREQNFSLRFAGPVPTLVRVFVNGEITLELNQSPFDFKLPLDTSLSNTVRVVASFADGTTQELTRTYFPPQVDQATRIDAFQIFPFLDASYANQKLEFESGRRDLVPEQFGPASEFTLDIVICLDVSGSMRWELDEIKPHLLKMLADLEAQEARIHLIVFDRNPRLLNYQQLPQLDLWERLYQGSAKSAVWDTLATATGFFSNSPRRMIFLISDGMDDGSTHNNETVTPFIRQSGASIVWMNPTNQTPGRVLRLTKDSGGFMLRGTEEEMWLRLATRMQHQMWLLAPSANYPIDLDIDDRDVWFPRWDD